MEQKIAQGVYDFRIMREDGYVRGASASRSCSPR